GHSTAQDWNGRITGSGIATGTTALTLDGSAYGLRLSFGTSSTPNTFTGDVVIKGSVVTQNQTYNGNIAANQNIGFRFNNLTVAPNAGWNIVWGGETVGALNGPGSVAFNCQSALNNIALTIGNTNQDGNFAGSMFGGFGIAKTGSATQVLSGSNTYGGATSVDAGKLVVNGSVGGSGVTVASGATLAGRGTVNSPLTMSAGSTLAAGDASTGTLTLTNSTVSLHDSGTVALRIGKSSGILSADRINLAGTSGLVYKGTLTITTVAGSDPLAAGDSFTLFSHTTGTLSGSFVTTNLPSLSPDLLWDTSRLTLDGVVAVKTLPLAEPPGFSLAAGIYVGPKSVDITSATSGASIRYTTDGSDPKISVTAITAVSPATVSIPAPAAITLKAFAFAAGFLDGNTASASYETLSNSSFVWANTAGGSWPVNGNWVGNAFANGTDVTARFDTLNVTADAAVTLDGARTLGGIRFADTTPSHNWTLNTGSGGPLTLAVTSGNPVISVSNQTTTLNTVLAGNQGLVKTGAGTLTLGAANTLTGTIIISQGRLALNSNTALPASANVVIGDANSGATAPNLYLGTQLTPTIATLTVGSGVAGAKLHTSGWAPTISGVTTLNSALTIQQYDGGYVHTGLQNAGRITGPGAGAGNDTLIFNYGGSQNFFWQASNAAANDFTGNIRVTGAPGTMNAQGGANGPNNIVIPDSAMVTIDSGCVFRWNNFANNAVVETFDGLSGAGSMNRNTSGGLISSLSLTINASNAANEGNRNFTGGLSSLDSFTFTGAGTQVFGGANSYTCPTTINGGTLLINGSQANTTTTVAAVGTLGGTGSIAGAVTNNGTLAPGSNGIGNLTINNTLSLAGGSKLAWEIANWTGTAGAGFDKLTATSLNLTATSASRITIKPAEVALANFTETNATFVIVQTSSGITGFSADKFTLDTSGLTLPHGTWAVQQSGNNLVLAYTAQTNPDANNNGILDTWETARFGNASPGANPPGGDPDSDGLCNLLEYAFNTNPSSGNVSPVFCDTTALVDGQHLRITVPKNPGATSLTYVVETCGALNDWSSANTTIESNTTNQLIVRDNFTQSSAASRFIRVKVVAVP
ncbi:MAG: autotransporter-associated beta strand repeat-containing protein, partial [Luteolibacter sp.]